MPSCAKMKAIQNHNKKIQYCNVQDAIHKKRVYFKYITIPKISFTLSFYTYYIYILYIFTYFDFKKRDHSKKFPMSAAFMNR